MEINKVTVTINGNEYILKSDYPEEHILKLANYVDGVIKDINLSYKKLSPQVLLVLSALNIADELFIAKEENSIIKKEMVLLKSEMNEKEQQLKMLTKELEKTKEELLKSQKELQEFLETFDGVE